MQPKSVGRKISSKNYNIIKKNKNWKQEENEYYLYDGLDMNVAVEYRNTNKGYKSWKELEAVKEYTYGDSELLFSKDLKKNYGYYIHENRWNKNIYYHQDQLGSTILTTGHMGKTEEKFEYDAYGLCYNGHLETANGYGFNGKKYDPTTKLYNYGYRHYSPNRKQWLTVDPIRNGGNWRLYCLSNPLYYIDYNGLDTLIVNIPGLTDNRLESFLIQAEIGIWPDEDLNDVVSPDDEEELNEELKDIDESVDTIIFTGGHSVDFYDTSKIDVELEKDTELYFATCEEGLDKEALSDSFGVLEENVSLNTGKSWADNSYNFVRDTIYLDNPIEEAWNDYIEANDLYEENPNLIPNYAIVE